MHLLVNPPGGAAAVPVPAGVAATFADGTVIPAGTLFPPYWVPGTATPLQGLPNPVPLHPSAAILPGATATAPGSLAGAPAYYAGLNGFQRGDDVRVHRPGSRDRGIAGTSPARPSPTARRSLPRAPWWRRGPQFRWRQERRCSPQERRSSFDQSNNLQPLLVTFGIYWSLHLRLHAGLHGGAEPAAGRRDHADASPLGPGRTCIGAAPWRRCAGCSCRRAASLRYRATPASAPTTICTRRCTANRATSALAGRFRSATPTFATASSTACAKDCAGMACPVRSPSTIPAIRGSRRHERAGPSQRACRSAQREGAPCMSLQREVSNDRNAQARRPRPDRRPRRAARAAPIRSSACVVEMDINQPAAAALTFEATPDAPLKLGDALEIDLGWTGDVRRVFTRSRLWTRADAPRNRHSRPSATKRNCCTAGRSRRFSRTRRSGDRESARPGSGRGDRLDRGRPARSARLPPPWQSRWDHCKELAARADSISYATEKGKLNFARFCATRRPITCCALGHDLPGLERSGFGQPLPGATVVPRSPASSAGDDTAAWLGQRPGATFSDGGRGAACSWSAMRCCAPAMRREARGAGDRRGVEARDDARRPEARRQGGHRTGAGGRAEGHPDERMSTASTRSGRCSTCSAATPASSRRWALREWRRDQRPRTSSS